MQTPWGFAEHQHDVAPGITFVSTVGHGGYRLAPERNQYVPQEYRTFAARWSKGWYDGSANREGWYEEDCAALAVVLTYPEYFPNADLDIVRKLLHDYVND